MAYTQDDVDRLKAAIAQGVDTVTFSDRTVKFRSIAEMERVLASIRQEVAGAPARNAYFPVITKGLE